MKHLLILLILSGCAKELTKVELQAIEDQRPTCHNAKQCEIAWAAARKWATTHAGMKFATYSDTFMETFNSGEKYSTHLTIQVSKDPIGGESYKIVMNSACRNFIGCDMDTKEAQESFNQAVKSAIVTGGLN